MIDPLTAIGLTGNVLQLIEFCLKTLSKGKELKDAKDGMLSDHRSAKTLAEDLIGINSKLEDHLSYLEETTSQKLDPEEQELRSISEACSGLAQELILKLLSLQSKKTRNPAKYIRDALLLVWNSKDIEDRIERLRQYKEQLNTHILVSLRLRIDVGRIEQSRGFAALDESGKEVLATLKSNHIDLTTQMQNLEAAMSDLIETKQTEIIEKLDSIPAPFDATRERTPTPMPPLTQVPDSHNNRLHEAVISGDLGKLREAFEANPESLNQRSSSLQGRTPLHTAAMIGDSKLVRFLLRIGARPDIDDNDLRTPLHYAVEADHYPVSRMLLAHGSEVVDVLDAWNVSVLQLAANKAEMQWILEVGPDIDVKSKQHQTALLHFTALGDEDVVRSLLTQNARTEIADKNNLTPLQIAAKFNRLSIAQLLLHRHANTEANGGGLTALNVAVTRGHTEMVKLLLKHGANQNAVGAFSNTSLSRALMCHNEDMAITLIRNGADLDALDSETLEPWHSAAKRGLMRVLSELMDHGITDHRNRSLKQSTGLLLACEEGNREVVKLLLKHSPLLYTSDNSNSGRLPLPFAAFNGMQDIVRLLCEAGVEVDCAENGERTALLEASWQNHVTCCRILLEHGADINSRDHDGKTALYRACERNHREVVSELLDRGADVNIKDKRGRNALTRLMENEGNIVIARGLIEYGISVDMPFKDGQRSFYSGWNGDNPLGIAAMKGRLEHLQVLIHRGKAQLDCRNGDGMTPLMEASKHGHLKIIEELLAHGARTDLTTNRNEIALDFARQGKHEDVIAALERETIDRRVSHVLA